MRAGGWGGGPHNVPALLLTPCPSLPVPRAPCPCSEAWDLSRCSLPAALAWNAARALWSAQQVRGGAAAHLPRRRLAILRSTRAYS